MTMREDDRQSRRVDASLRAERQGYMRANYPGDLADDLGLNNTGRWDWLGQLRWPIAAGVAVAAVLLAAAGLWWVTIPSGPASTTIAEQRRHTPQPAEAGPAAASQLPVVAVQPHPVVSILTRTELEAIALRAKVQFALSMRGQHQPALPSVTPISMPSLALYEVGRPDLPVSPATLLRRTPPHSSFSLPSRKDLL